MLPGFKRYISMGLGKCTKLTCLLTPRSFVSVEATGMIETLANQLCSWNSFLLKKNI